jgi:NAD(P)H-nitrite reductase large subunit
MNSIEFYGIPTISVGISNPPEESYEILKKSDFSHQTYRKLVLKRDILVGALLVGNIERAGVLTGLIRDKIEVSAFKHSLLEEELGLILLPRNLREKRLSQKD